jgi:hypothetical protein
MGNALKKMEDGALKLPARSRARLAERLIASLEKVIDPEAESKWFDFVPPLPHRFVSFTRSHRCALGFGDNQP